MSGLGEAGYSAFTAQLRSSTHLAGLLLPLLVVTTGLLVRAGYLPSEHYHSDTAFLLVSAALVALALEQYTFKSKKFLINVIEVIGYTFFGALYLLFVTGFDSPLTIMWLALMLYIDVYFGRKALIASAVSLVGFAAIDIAMISNYSSTSILNIIVMLILIIVIAMIISYMRSIDQNERKAFEHTKKQNTLQKERLVALINAMGDAVISTDAKGVIHVYNAAALSLLDTNQTVTGRSIDGLFHLIDQEGKPEKMTELLKLAKSHVVLDDYSHRYEDGEAIHLYISIAPLRPAYQQKGRSGFIIVMRDITKEKSLEEERDEFISVVSHELRTPVAITEGAISNLALMFERGLTDKSQISSVIDSAHEQVVYLSKMINDLSTLSRAERGVADESEIIDVTELAHNLYSQYRPAAEAKQLNLNLDAGQRLGSVKASRLYLEEVLQNFITNAIKYTKEGSITLKITRTADKVHFSVADTGIGMSKGDQKHIYDKFYRSEDYRTRETSGTGLGLYVVQKLAAKLGIDIKLQSRLNHGSTFSFDLPCAKEEA